jgi:hypothetical protein
MKTQYAWKVCHVKNGKFQSSIWNRPVFYSTSRWTKPKNEDSQWLFVLKTRRHARQYVRDILDDRRRLGQTFRIFKCEVKNPTTTRKAVDSRGIPYVTKSVWFPFGTRSQIGKVICRK